IYGYAATEPAGATTGAKLAKLVESGENGTGEPALGTAEDMARLCDMTTKEAVRQHLLSGLVPAAYRPQVKKYPSRDARAVSKIHTQMAALARHTFRHGKDKNQQDIDWWRLHRLCPARVIGLEIGLIVGPLLGVAAGLAVTVKAGHTAGLIM